MGQNSRKSGTFGQKVGHPYKFDKNSRKLSNLVHKLGPKKAVKRRDRVMKKWDRGKFPTENRDCPSKTGTVGGLCLAKSNDSINYNCSISDNGLACEDSSRHLPWKAKSIWQKLCSLASMQDFCASCNHPLNMYRLPCIKILILYTYCHSRTTIPGNITSSLPRIVTSAKHE